MLHRLDIYTVYIYIQKDHKSIREKKSRASAKQGLNEITEDQNGIDHFIS